MDLTQMETVLPVTEALFGRKPLRAVTDRDLHAALGVSEIYTRWFRQVGKIVQPERYRDFVENKQARRPAQGKGRTERYLSLEAAIDFAKNSPADIKVVARVVAYLEQAAKEAVVADSVSARFQADTDTLQSEAAVTPMPIVLHRFDDDEEPAVYARDLHAALEIRKRFTDWIEDQITRGNMVLGQDYGVFHKKVKNLLGGRPEKEYILRADAAKHIAMMSQSDKAKAIRQYFIEVEKKYRRQILSDQEKVFQQVLEEKDRTWRKEIEDLLCKDIHATSGDTSIHSHIADVLRQAIKDLARDYVAEPYREQFERFLYLTIQSHFSEVGLEKISMNNTNVLKVKYILNEFRDIFSVYEYVPEQWPSVEVHCAEVGKDGTVVVLKQRASRDPRDLVVKKGADMKNTTMLRVVGHSAFRKRRTPDFL